MSKDRAPLNDTILVAVAALVEDSGVPREPTHSELDFLFKRCGLVEADPRAEGQSVGKQKRVRMVLSWAMENAADKGERLVSGLVAMLRGHGGFRAGNPNYVGDNVVRNAQDAFRAEGFDLGSDGTLQPRVLEGISGAELTGALRAYVERARRGVTDAALVAGTGKDLLEATAGHVLQSRFGTYPSTANFPTLLGQAFTELGLATSATPSVAGEAPKARVERALYEVALTINHLRNKEGTGHGRPWPPSISDSEARAATEVMGAIAGRMLDCLAGRG